MPAHHAVWPARLPAKISPPVTSLWMNLAISAMRYPDKPAVVYMTRVWSYRELQAAAEKMACALAALGVRAGDRVILNMQNCPQLVITHFAILRLDAVVVPVNPMNKAEELKHYITDPDARVAVTTADLAPELAQASDALPADQQLQHLVVTQFSDVFDPEAVADDDMPQAWRSWLLPVRDLPTLAAGETHAWRTLLEAAPDASLPPVQASRDDLAILPYTSGTTGRSKGAMLTHGNMLSNALTLKDYWGWKTSGGPDGRGDVLIHALPIFHVHGLFVAIHGALINGSKMIWMAKFDPKRAIGYMAKATVFMGVPTLYVRMLAEPTLNKAAVKNMRLFIAGSAPLLIETFTEWQERTGHTILERYGMSETAMLTSNPYASDKRYGQQSARRGGTVGFPLPGVSLRVRGDDGQDLPVGEIGGIQVQGPNVFKGYWRMPEKTAEEFTADAYFKTGDVGKVDERGYVTIVGRSKDLIISGGYNVYPAEIEGYINEMKGVAESAVVGVPHPDFGEVGVAVVIAKAGAALQPEAIIAELKAKLANFKIPKKCFVVTELPRNTMSKVQKNLLRDQYKGLFA